MDKRQGVEILTGNYQTPIRDAWNYLLWTSPLTIRRTSSSIVSTTVAATFTLDVFPGGSTSWPSLTTTPPLATQPKEPACIPATLIQPVLSRRAKRDASTAILKSVKPYVTRESTTVVVKIRDNYLQVTSNVPTVTQAAAITAVGTGALQALTTQTIAVETVAPDGSTQTLSVVVVKPSDSLDTGSQPSAALQRLGTPDATGESFSSGDDDDDDNDDSSGGGGGGGGGGVGDDDDSKTNPAGSHIQKLTDNQRVVNMPYTAASYFGSMYAPALTAIFVKILFEPMLAALKGMEPFERLHREQGATAEDSLCSQYLSSSLSWDTIRSIWTGSAIPLWTTIIYLMVSISAPLASASMTVRPMDECFINNAWMLCSPAWVIDIRFLRILEALLVICIALTLVLLWSSWKYHAGVPTNPTSIASVAVLLNYEPLRQDLQAIDPDATADELERALEEYHFWLIPHSPSRNESRYGFVHAQASNTLTTPTAPNMPTFLTKFESRYNRLRPHLHSRHTVRLADSVHLFTTFALLALLATYRANTNSDAFNNFFASNTFWPKFLLVALATSLDMQWKSLEREVRITEPYRRLHLGNARPENTILRSLNGTCWSNLPRALRDLFRYSHMWFEAIVGVTAIISDFNIIAVSGVLMTYSQTRAAYQWSSITALTTTSFMLSMLLLVVFWWRRTDAVSGMPRSPETVGAVLSYLCISRMAMDFAHMGMVDLSKEERDRVIVGKGKRYRFGRMFGEDGKERYCIDYDGDDDANSERTSWLQAKMERPVAVRLST